MDGDGDTDVDGLHVLTGIEHIHQHYFSTDAELHNGFDYDLREGHFGRCRAIWVDDEWAGCGDGYQRELYCDG